MSPSSLPAPPSPRCDIVEEHASVLPIWWALGRHPRTVIYLDAHLDLQPLEDDAMVRLRQCDSAQSLAALERPHPLDPSPEPVYGLEDWLYPAHRLGLVKELIWVVPPHVGTGFDARALAQLCQTDGVTLDDLDSFHRTAGGWIEGRLLGLPMRICALAQLPMLPLPNECLIDIDTDFFVSLPEDQPWISALAVHAVLAALPTRIEHITLTRSVSSGFMPARCGHVADQLAALWRGQAGASPSAPPAAVTPSVAEWDVPTLLREACAIRHRRLPVDLTTVLRMQMRLNELSAPLQRPSGPAPQGVDPHESAMARARAGWCWAALGLLFARFGRWAELQQCQQQCQALCGPHPELALAMGRLLAAQQRSDAAVPWLQQATLAPKWRSQAQAHLAQLWMARGDLPTALALIDQALARSPAWADLLGLRAAVLRGLDRPADAAEAQARMAQVGRACAAVARRLA